MKHSSAAETAVLEFPVPFAAAPALPVAAIVPAAIRPGPGARWRGGIARILVVLGLALTVAWIGLMALAAVMLAGLAI